jgi:nucleoside-diphosphate-sugar epimerase
MLVESGADVTIVDAFVKPYGANLFNVKDIKDKVKINIADIGDTEAMKILVKDKNVIINLAGQVCHNDSIESPLYDAKLNYLYQLNVMDCVKKYNPEAKMIFAGSRLQFGKINTLPVDETHSISPETPYALHKQATENMYRFYHNQHSINTVVFRIANPYGPRGQIMHPKYSIANYFIRQALEGKTIQIYGDGNQLRDYIFVDDLADAFIRASLTEKSNGEVFNIGSGKGISFKSMVKTIVEIVGKGNYEHVQWPGNYVNVETGDYITDIGKVKQYLKWNPKIKLVDGMKITVDYYQRYITEYLSC